MRSKRLHSGRTPQPELEASIDKRNHHEHNHLSAALREANFSGDRVVIERFPGEVPASRASSAQRALVGGNASRRCGSDRGNAWLTPPEFVEQIRHAFGGAIDLDPCTEPGNPTRAKRYYALADDGLTRRWRGRVYCNPPYTPAEPWIDHAILQSARGARIYLLLPVRTDAAYHHRLLGAATDVLFIRGRLRFARADGGSANNPAFGSMVIGLGISCVRLSHLGIVLERSRARAAA